MSDKVQSTLPYPNHKHQCFDFLKYAAKDEERLKQEVRQARLSALREAAEIASRKADMIDMRIGSGERYRRGVANMVANDFREVSEQILSLIEEEQGKTEG